MELPLLESHPTCTSCALHLTARSVGLPTIRLEDSLAPSSQTPAVLFVGRNPGFHEDEQGVPFVGRSGVLLRGGYIKQGGFGGWTPATQDDPDPTTAYAPGAYIDGISLRSRATVYITNIVRCYTSSDANPSWSSHLRPCFPHFLTDLLSICQSCSHLSLFLISGNAIQAFHALILGGKRLSVNDALKHNGRSHTLYFHTTPSSLVCTTDPSPPLPKKKPKKSAPPPDPVTTHGPFRVTSFASFHPSFILREPNAMSAVEGHLQLLSNALAGLTPTPSAPHLIPVRDPRS